MNIHDIHLLDLLFVRKPSMPSFSAHLESILTVLFCSKQGGHQKKSFDVHNNAETHLKLIPECNYEAQTLMFCTTVLSFHSLL